MEKIQSTIINARQSYPDINWTDFNWPPCLGLFHFDLSELNDPYKGIVRLLYISYLMIFVATVFNIINAIAQAAVGYSSIIILYAFLNFFIFNGVQMYIFYRGYKGLCSEYGLLKLYKLFHLIIAVWWLVVSIVGFGGFNGFAKIHMFVSAEEGGLVFLSVVESLLFLFSFIIAPVCVCKIHQFSAKGDNL